MWEDLTLVLCCLGFAAVVAVLYVELPAVLRAAQSYASRHRHGLR